MEKEELLRILISLIFVNTMLCAVYAEDNNMNILSSEAWPITQDNANDNINSLVEQSRFNVLKQMLEQYNGEQLAQGKDIVPAETTQLRVFVSSSMPSALLRAYIAEAIRFKATIVFRGLINNSWRETISLISSVNTEEGSSIIMDDETFDKYEISSVPTMVLSKEPGVLNSEQTKIIYDKLVGNIGIKAALDKFAAEGDLHEEAAKWLK